MINHYYIKNGIVHMEVKRKSTNQIFEAKFHEEYLDIVSQFDEWLIMKNQNIVYARIGNTEKNQLLHRLIYGSEQNDGRNIFTRNRNYLDCQKENLYTKS